MVGRKIMAGVTCMLMLAGCFTKAPLKAKAVDLSASPMVSEATLEEGGVADLGVANEEKIIEMLKKEGFIPQKATYEEAHKIYLQYMKKTEKENTKNSKITTGFERQEAAKQALKIKRYKFNELPKDTNPKKVKILAILIDYADYKHDNISPGDTDMYYDDYSVQHYKDMLFGDNGYKGPNGENLISMKQYYAEQSGGSLDVEGTVVGWYTAPKDAKYYGEQVGSNNDIRPKYLVAHALAQLANDPSINLADYDQQDLYDLDGDGIYNEPDGIIDYLMVLHAGVGQEAGGGALGTDAIWSHSSSMGGLYPVGESGYYAYKYTIEPEDGATGVFAHEFGHNLGLPDEYDTNYSSDSGEPIGYWSIMSSGSWTGKIPGTEPSGFSPYAKMIFEGLYGGNWQNRIQLDSNSLSKTGSTVAIRQANQGGQVVQINLPDRNYSINTPPEGTKEYYGGIGTDGNPIKTSMTAQVSLPSAAATLSFKAWYDIEEGWDFATVQAREKGTDEWTCLEGNITTSEHNSQAEVTPAYGITGSSNGQWVDGVFDLSAFAGKTIELKFEYETDSYTFGRGFYVDNIAVTSGGSVLFEDGAEGTPKFTLNGFKVDTGKVSAKNYYLVEWRNQKGTDRGLAHISTLGQVISYDPGMLVWYVNEFYTDNWGANHPGGGFLSIVDADQNELVWKYTTGEKSYASNKFQMHDAAFHVGSESKAYIDLTKEYGRTLTDSSRSARPLFTDKKSYLNPEIPTLGVDLPKLGITINILKQAKDDSSATLLIKK